MGLYLFVLILIFGILLKPALSWMRFERHLRNVLRKVEEDFPSDVVMLYVLTMRERIYETFQEAMAKKKSHEEFFKEIAEYLSGVFGCDSYSVLLTPKDGEWSFTAWSSNLDKVNLRKIAKALSKAENSNISEVIEKKSVLYIPDTRKHERWRELETPVRTWIGVPLMIGGEVVGVINLDWFEPDRVRSYMIESLSRIVQDLEKVLNSMEEFRNVVLESDIDILLGIPNRRAFEKFSRIVEAEGKRIGIVLIDLERFKKINEVYGYTIGNEVLKRVKDRILSSIRKEDRLFRFGGDELALVIEEPTLEKMDVVSRKMKHVFLRVFEVDREGVPVFVKLNAKVGWSIFPDEADSIERALEIAKKRLV